MPTAVSAAVIAVMVYLAPRGLDMVDESYLLRMIRDAQATRPTGDVYLFGFVLRPLYELTGRDVAAFRLVAFVVMGLSASALCRECVRLLTDRGVVVARQQAWAAYLAAAASSMTLFSFNVTIPAYRFMTVLGLMATTAGLARLARGREIVGGSLVGIGLSTCFIGKPTSAALAAVLVGAFVLSVSVVSRKAATSALLSAAATVTITLLAARMTPWEAVTYLSRGAHQSQLLGGHAGIAMMLGWGQVRIAGLLVFGSLLALPLLAGWFTRGEVDPRRRPAVDVSTAAAIAAVGVVLAALGSRLLAPTGFGWQMLSIGLVLPIVTVVWLSLDVRRGGAKLRRPEIGVLLFLLLAPYVSAVGSNVPFGVGMPLADVFWAIALVMACLTRAPRPGSGHFFVVLTFVSMVAAISVWVVHHDGLDGGDLGSTLQAAPVEGGQLMLRPTDAQAARLLRAAAVRYGIDDRTPVVDLTGVGAGYALMTGGRPLGRAHMYGYLPNSIPAARSALATATCHERATAWLIYAPHDRMDISPALTNGVLSLSTDYEPVVEFTSRQIRGTWQMELLRPRLTVSRKLGC